MPIVSRYVKESPTNQGIDETVMYSVDFSGVLSAPTSATVKVYDIDNALQDVSATVLSGSATISGNIVTTPLFLGSGMTEGHKYLVRVNAVKGSESRSSKFEIHAEF